jgi:3,4-dihydroxy 2-butanone 4-phosphate synthase/GTP cyclohydrolase II
MRLADWLDQNGITKTAFAARAGISPSTMTDLCRGTQWVSATVALAIERETEGAVTVADLLAEYRANQERAA